MKNFTNLMTRIVMAMAACAMVFVCSCERPCEETGTCSSPDAQKAETPSVLAILVLVDKDGDGFAGAATAEAACDVLAGEYREQCLALFDGKGTGSLSSALKVGDCNDNDATTYPGASEVLDGKDNNCDGQPMPGEILNGVSCDDSDTCTTGDVGVDGVCVGTDTSDCDDLNLCTTDSCDPAGGCQHANNTLACDDGNACTTGDICAIGACVGGPAPNCDDSDLCTTDSCVPATGCAHTAVNTDDGDACTTDTCDPATGVSHTPVVCNDSDVCTTNSCDPLAGCVYTPIPGCCKTDADCNDQSVCTTDTCEVATGVCSHTAVSCDDTNICTDDTCNPATGCAHVNNIVACDDGDACTDGDQCKDGACSSGPATDCDDSNVCTTDSCDQTGCQHANNTLACDDGNACTTNDTCASGVCMGGPATDCNDNDLCTTDSCDDPATGCEHSTIVGCCKDGNDADCSGWEPLGYQLQAGGWWHLGPYSYGCLSDHCGVCEDTDNDGSCALNEVQCVDLVDGDNDGQTDCADADCATAPVCQPPAPQAPVQADWVFATGNTPSQFGLYVSCTSGGPEGNFWKGWVPLPPTPTCDIAVDEYCLQVNDVALTTHFSWNKAGSLFSGCMFNMYNAVSQKWVPGWDPGEPGGIYNPTTSALFTHNGVQTDLVVTPNDPLDLSKGYNWQGNP